jgi:hypothetical protein
MDRKFKLDDSFKKALEEAVVSDTPASSWMDDYKADYQRLVSSGMFWEFHPTWTGEWEKDKYAFCHVNKFKKGGTQDPAICEYSGLRPVEGYKEEERIDKEAKKKRDRDYMYNWIREKSGK